MQNRNYQRLAEEQAELQELQQQLANIPAGNATGIAQIAAGIERVDGNIEGISGNIRRTESDQSKLRSALTSRKCPNIHEEADDGCSTYFEVDHPEDRVNPNTDRARYLGFSTEFKQSYLAAYDKANGTNFSDLEGEESKIDHMTPIAAGGCPTSPKNLIPHAALTPGCTEVDEIQTRLQNA